MGYLKGGFLGLLLGLWVKGGWSCVALASSGQSWEAAAGFDMSVVGRQSPTRHGLIRGHLLTFDSCQINEGCILCNLAGLLAPSHALNTSLRT